MSPVNRFGISALRSPCRIMMLADLKSSRAPIHVRPNSAQQGLPTIGMEQAFVTWLAKQGTTDCLMGTTRLLLSLLTAAHEPLLCAALNPIRRTSPMWSARLSTSHVRSGWRQ